jgi:hypothetical protein
LRAENIVIKPGQAFEVENFYALEQMLGKVKAIRAPVNGRRSKRLGNFASAKWIAGQLRLFAAETVWIRLEGDDDVDSRSKHVVIGRIVKRRSVVKRAIVAKLGTNH